jgi:hypothetical protein
MAESARRPCSAGWLVTVNDRGPRLRHASGTNAGLPRIAAGHPAPAPAPRWTKYWWTEPTATAPSPAAPATRLTEP